mmetsp:Transcript_114002/g.303017  ORF Transcript_114002/g.303017 Transcript_114002/m.303017 type:complete len:214 (+) Transcript_114002:1544-2185(+)
MRHGPRTRSPVVCSSGSSCTIRRSPRAWRSPQRAWHACGRRRVAAGGSSHGCGLGSSYLSSCPRASSRASHPHVGVPPWRAPSSSTAFSVAEGACVSPRRSCGGSWRLSTGRYHWRTYPGSWPAMRRERKPPASRGLAVAFLWASAAAALGRSAGCLERSHRGNCGSSSTTMWPSHCLMPWHRTRPPAMQVWRERRQMGSPSDGIAVGRASQL